MATAFIMVGSIVFLFSRCINEILFGSFRYPDIRYSLPAESEVTPLPQMEAGKYEVWIEFTGHCRDLTGIAWKATTIDLASGEVTDSDDLRLATYGTGDGMRGVGVGTMRAATGRRYGLRIQCEECEEGQSRVVLAHRPRVVVRPPWTSARTISRKFSSGKPASRRPASFLPSSACWTVLSLFVDSNMKIDKAFRIGFAIRKALSICNALNRIVIVCIVTSADRGESDVGCP